MSRNLLPSAITFLESNTRVRIAHLVILELPTSTEEVPVYDYLTDYATEIVVDGRVYSPDRVVKIGDVRQGTRLTNYKLNIDIAGEYQAELDRALNENKQSSFVGKSMRVLRAYLDDEGEVVPFDKDTGGPMEYFFGNISSVSIADGVVNGSSKVTWQCAGKFGDFNLVNGRVTDDATHRGLEASSNTNELIPGTGAKKEIYKTDTGFQHANQTINLISNYTTTETRYKMKSSFLGLKSKLKEYEVEVVKELELGVDLAAGYLPFVRGVRRVPGIPIFLDNMASRPSHLYVVYAICEGPATLLNVYVDGESAICLDEAQEDTDMCLGSQANGDTLSKFIRSDSGYKSLHNSYSPKSNIASRLDGEDYYGYTGSVVPQFDNNSTKPATAGIDEATTFTITNSSGVKKFTYYPGTSDQQADPTLVNVASMQNFFVQKEQGRGSDYWDANSRLLDTAYIILEMDISEEEQEVPELEFVVECHRGSGDNEIVSLNPTDHLEDYLLNSAYGGSLKPEELDFASFDYVRQVYDRAITSYDKDWVTYWRYTGWRNNEDYIPKYLECNTLILTDETVTKNIENILEQMDGTINQLGGKYHLSIEDDSDPIADIHIDEVIGAVNVKDTSDEGKWNSISANLVDPSLSWSSNKLVFFDSEYLEQDKNVQKKGNVSFNYITNYYVARNWAKRKLDKSRYSREITIKTYYKYIYLYPNANVTFTYPRFNWDKKLLRVSSMTMLADGLVSLTLKDTDYSIYTDIDDNEIPTPPIPSGGIPRPSGFRYVSADTSEFNFPDSQDNVFGYLVWNPYDSDTLLRYEVENWNAVGIPERNFTVPTNRTVDSTATGEPFVYYPITDVDIDVPYLFKARALDRYGKYSKYAILEKTFGTENLPSSYSPVTGFTATNIDEQNQYVGNTVRFTWDLHPSDLVTDYLISFVDEDNNNTEYGQISVPATVESECFYNFTLEDNMSMYSSNHSGMVGAYRGYNVRIKALAGNASSEWTYL